MEDASKGSAATDSDRDQKARGRAPRHVTQLAVAVDPRQNMIVMAAACDDGTIWSTMGDEDWVELLGVPGTAARLQRDGA